MKGLPLGARPVPGCSPPAWCPRSLASFGAGSDYAQGKRCVRMAPKVQKQFVIASPEFWNNCGKMEVLLSRVKAHIFAATFVAWQAFQTGVSDRL